MSKFKTIGCLALLLVNACGSAGSGGGSAPGESTTPGDEAGFDPAVEKTDDSGVNAEEVSPPVVDPSPEGDTGSAGDPTPSDPTEPVSDSGAPSPATPPASDAGTTAKPDAAPAPKDTGAPATKDSGAAPADTAVHDSGTPSVPPVVDSGTVHVPPTDSGAAVDTGTPVVTPPPPTTPPATTPPSASCTELANDLAARDALPQSGTATSSWYTSAMQGGWGPAAASFPVVATPSGCDRVAFQRARVLAAAKHYIGLAYQHHHVPAWNPSSAWSGAEGPGLDCSNYTSWVYNYGLGIKFTSSVVDQANTAGRLLAPSEPLQPGDLLYITDAAGSAIAHVVIYVDASTIIDDTSSATAVGLRPFTGWYKTRFSHARRVIE